MDHIIRRARTRGLQSGCFQLCGSQFNRKVLIKGWTYIGEAEVESVQHPSKPRKKYQKAHVWFRCSQHHRGSPGKISIHSRWDVHNVYNSRIQPKYSNYIQKKKKKVKYTVQVLWRKKLCYRSYLYDATVSFISNTFGYWDVTFFNFFVLH